MTVILPGPKVGWTTVLPSNRSVAIAGRVEPVNLTGAVLLGKARKPLAGPRHADVAEPALLLDVTASERGRMGE